MEDDQCESEMEKDCMLL